MNQNQNKQSENSFYQNDYIAENSEETNSKKRYFLYFFFFTILLFFCVFGISYSVYYGDSGGPQDVETENILFTYSDVNQAGNGIQIKNASPIPDSIGKSMVKTGEYFDFYITATTTKSDLFYQILIRKDELSTLADSDVKLYLTQVMGGMEQDVVLHKVSELKQVEVEKQQYYVLYEKTLFGPLDNHHDSYRLRMWVAEDAIGYEDKKFAIKVDVSAYQVEE